MGRAGENRDVVMVSQCDCVGLGGKRDMTKSGRQLSARADCGEKIGGVVMRERNMIAEKRRFVDDGRMAHKPPFGFQCWALVFCASLICAISDVYFFFCLGPGFRASPIWAFSDLQSGLVCFGPQQNF